MADTQVSGDSKPVEKIFKGDAGDASVGASTKVAEERHLSAMEEAMAAITGTDKDMAGRIVPMGEPVEDPLFQSVARYFEVHERDFKDSSHDIGFIIEYLKNYAGVKGVDDIEKIFTFLRTLEDNLSPNQDFDTKRYQRVYNYLVMKEKAEAMNRAVAMLERNRGKYGD